MCERQENEKKIIFYERECHGITRKISHFNADLHKIVLMQDELLRVVWHVIMRI